MAIRQIPVRNDIPAYNFRINLDNRPFLLSFSFNDRRNRWTLNMADEAGTELLNGITLFTKIPLIDKYQHDIRLPQGNLFALNLVNDGVPPTRDNLATDVQLFYEEAVS